jgi:hypothetical protein
MSAIAVEFEVGRWIKAQIEGQTDLVCWLDIIPESAHLPAVRFQTQSREDVVTVERHIALTRFIFLVVATVRGGDLAELVGFAEDIHEALHRQSGSTAKATILSCARTAPFVMTDVQGADVFRHGGGMYEVFAREIP